jgi:hypothetical protein
LEDEFFKFAVFVSECKTLSGYDSMSAKRIAQINALPPKTIVKPTLLKCSFSKSRFVAILRLKRIAVNYL